MFNTSNIHTLTEFTRKPSEHIQRISETKQAELLTVNGKGAVVVQDAETYERMAELAEYAESIRSIKQALNEESISINDFRDQFETKFGIKNEALKD